MEQNSMNKKHIGQKNFAEYWAMILLEAWKKSWDKWGMWGIIFPGIVSLATVWIVNREKPLDVILGENWILYAAIFMLLYIVTVVFFILKEPVFVYNDDQICILQLRNEIRDLESELPNILFGEPKYIEVNRCVNDYGANSFIAKQISPKTPFYLFCIDFRNKPINPKGSDALGVQALLEFYGDNDEKCREYFGRWINMPERVLNENHRYIDLPSDGMTEKCLGIMYISGKSGNDFYLLDSDVVDNAPEGAVLNPPFLLSGKYTLVVNISGRNFSELSPKVYEVQSLKDERLIFAERKDSKKWLQKIENDKKKLARMWSSVNQSET
jgi:hypothetical protein